MDERRREAPKPARFPGLERTNRPGRPGEGPEGMAGRRQDPAPAPAAAARTEEPDVEEVVLAAEDATWRIRVLGRSSRARGAAPLMLLGFWEGPSEGPPPREKLVVGRRLADLAEDALRAALADAAPPRDPGRRRAFFPEADQGRGGRSEGR